MFVQFKASTVFKVFHWIGDWHQQIRRKRRDRQKDQRNKQILGQWVCDPTQEEATKKFGAFFFFFFKEVRRRTHEHTAVLISQMTHLQTSTKTLAESTQKVRCSRPEWTQTRFIVSADVTIKRHCTWPSMYYLLGQSLRSEILLHRHWCRKSSVKGKQYSTFNSAELSLDSVLLQWLNTELEKERIIWKWGSQTEIVEEFRSGGLYVLGTDGIKSGDCAVSSGSNHLDTLDSVDTAVHNAVRSVTTERRLINVSARLSARPQCIIKSKLSITDPCANSISLLWRHFDNGIQTGGQRRQ